MWEMEGPRIQGVIRGELEDVCRKAGIYLMRGDGEVSFACGGRQTQTARGLMEVDAAGVFLIGPEQDIRERDIRSLKMSFKPLLPNGTYTIRYVRDVAAGQSPSAPVAFPVSA